MKIGFLACPETMPASGTERRGDAFEHDLQVAALRPAYAAHSLELVEVDWHSPLDRFRSFDLVQVGTPWDYQDHADAFLAKLDAIEENGIQVCNSPSLIRWNIQKTYLRDLESSGAQIIPTLWIDNPTGKDIPEALDRFGSDAVVVKRQIGGGAIDQHRFERGALPDATWQAGYRAMIQPFLPAIKDEGELSFVFIDGQYSHGIRKIAASGDYRIQSLYGGREETLDPSEADIAAASTIVKSMPGDTPLYARIDMLRGDKDELVVMEAEVIEPYLYPEQGPELGKRLATAIVKRLS